MEPLRHLVNALLEAVIFRRTRPQIKQPGGLLSVSETIYPEFGANLNRTELVWEFPTGMRIKFAQLQHEKSKFEWQGSQIALAILDELTHFTEGQFWYIVSRMRSTCGVRPYLRATCNPDADSWVADLIAWWIDQDTGYPIIERSGHVRWFVRDGNILLWADSPEELRKLVPKWKDSQFRPKSLTFIAATIFDNQELLEKDPDYLANLMALPLVEREQLLGGNWKIRPAAGLLFKEIWFPLVEAPPADAERIRIWDFASTKEQKNKTGETTNDPDWSVGLLLSLSKSTGLFCVEDIVRLRGTELEVETAVKNTALKDGKRVKIAIPTDPGQAGKFQYRYYSKLLRGFDVRSFEQRENKVQRAKPASAQAEAGNIQVVIAPWNKPFFQEAENFPDGAHDDQIDPLAVGVSMLSLPRGGKMRTR